MRINLEKILDHANERLALIEGQAGREEQVEGFKRFLKLENERLRIRHRFGLGGSEITAGRSYLVDLVICRACNLAASELGATAPELSNCAIVALGGYGRRDLAPFSDVDVLFLHAGRRSKSVKQFLERVLYLLWDMGLTVGHSFRSVSECVAMAKSDLHSRTAMGEARLVIGNSHLFRRLLRELDDAVFKNKREADAFLEAMRAELEARYAKFGKAVCLQEPNVKESAGGLRDLHAALWAGHAAYGCRSLDELRAEDYISGAEYLAVRRAYDFLSRVRNEAHFSTGRKTDLLILDLQPLIAEGLGYKPKRGLAASELFMRDYYRRAQELHHFCQSFYQRATAARSVRRHLISRAKQVAASFEFKQGKLYLTIKSSPQTQASQARFVIRAGKLHLKQEPGDFHSNPMRLMEVFHLAQRERAELSQELKLAIRAKLHLIDRRFRAAKESGQAFIEILQQRGRVGPALRSMHETGFLARFMPEFGRITFLVQHDFYHKYTIDEHTLKAIEALDHLATDRDEKLARFAKVFAEVESTAPLYLGLLLHDIGKGRGSGHVERGVRIAERVSKRLELDQQSADTVVFLVRHHLLMSHLSQRRDLTEESLIEEFVAKIGNLDRLNMLLLLTYADTSGVGPGVWNDWKAGLLWELYSRARSHFVASPTRWGRSQIAALKGKIIAQLAPEFLPSEVERHIAMLPERYLRATSPDQMARHLRLIKRLGTAHLVADWQTIPDKHCTELTICTQDSAGLVARIAGTLTSHGINILSADLYTREDSLVLDTFKICELSSHYPVRPELWQRVEQKLRLAIEGNYDVAAAVERWRACAAGGPRATLSRRRPLHLRAEPSVRFDSETSQTCTIIEVRAEDEPGLVYKIASTLTRLKLNITFARITTEKALALDVFYVMNSNGNKLTRDETAVVERELLASLGAKPKMMKEAI
jgi:[protein-PII] uridylyltransferase